MCGYIYLLWLQYWRHISVKNQQTQELTYTQQQPYVEYYDEGDFTTAHQRNGNPLMRISEALLDKTERIRQVTYIMVFIDVYLEVGSILQVIIKYL